MKELENFLRNNEDVEIFGNLKEEFREFILQGYKDFNKICKDLKSQSEKFFDSEGFNANFFNKEFKRRSDKAYSKLELRKENQYKFLKYFVPSFIFEIDRHMPKLKDGFEKIIEIKTKLNYQKLYEMLGKTFLQKDYYFNEETRFPSKEKFETELENVIDDPSWYFENFFAIFDFEAYIMDESKKFLSFDDLVAAVNCKILCNIKDGGIYDFPSLAAGTKDIIANELIASDADFIDQVLEMNYIYHFQGREPEESIGLLMNIDRVETEFAAEKYVEHIEKKCKEKGIDLTRLEDTGTRKSFLELLEGPKKIMIK